MDASFYAARQSDERAAREAAGQDTPLFAQTRAGFAEAEFKAEGALLFQAESAAERLRRRASNTDKPTLRIATDELAQIASVLGRVASIASRYHMERADALPPSSLPPAA